MHLTYPLEDQGSAVRYLRTVVYLYSRSHTTQPQYTHHTSRTGCCGEKSTYQIILHWTGRLVAPERTQGGPIPRLRLAEVGALLMRFGWALHRHAPSPHVPCRPPESRVRYRSVGRKSVSGRRTTDATTGGFLLSPRDEFSRSDGDRCDGIRANIAVEDRPMVLYNAWGEERPSPDSSPYQGYV